MLARSVGQLAVDHRTPIEQRWGGWYYPAISNEKRPVTDEEVAVTCEPEGGPLETPIDVQIGSAYSCKVRLRLTVRDDRWRMVAATRVIR